MELMWDLGVMDRVASESGGMPSANYHRKQAQLFAALAVATSSPQIAARYNAMALEHLAKAEAVEPSSAQHDPASLSDDGGSDMDRD